MGSRWQDLRLPAGERAKWFDVAAKKSYDVVDLTELDDAALSPPAPERYEWENRRVDEATLQWSPKGHEVLYDGGGDLVPDYDSERRVAAIGEDGHGRA